MTLFVLLFMIITIMVGSEFEFFFRIRIHQKVSDSFGSATLLFATKYDEKSLKLWKIHLIVAKIGGSMF
jgi:hypothetical protein